MNEFMLNLKLVNRQVGTAKFECVVNPEDDSINGPIEVDIIVTFDLFGPSSELDQYRYRRDLTYVYGLFKQNPYYANEFSASLAETQRDFMTARLERRLTNLILLTKNWIKTEVRQHHPKLKFPSYLVELVCLHVWETKLQDRDYEIADAFQEVMRTFVNYRSLNCTWLVNYRACDLPFDDLRERGDSLTYVSVSLVGF